VYISEKNSQGMSWIKTNFDNVWVFEPKIWKDQRGYFVETYNASGLPADLKDVTFVQDNEAASTRGVLRGLHYQLPPYAQSKLVRVVSGEVLDVIVDIRPQSPTFGNHLAVILNDMNKKQLFVPKGFAHGYIVLSDSAVFAYKCDQYYAPDHEAGIHCHDTEININWILEKNLHLISAKDMLLPTFAQHKPYK
jgi:dTDP-4-dehydrorhamnose 3,5-epimerase